MEVDPIPISLSTRQNDFLLKYCRTCGTQLSQGEGLLIFGAEGKSLQLSEKIRKTCSVLVLEEDKLPKRICFNCCNQLEEYSQFKENVHDTQDKLRAIVRNLDPNISPAPTTGTSHIRSLFNSTSTTLNSSPSPISGSRLERALLRNNGNNLIEPLPSTSTSVSNRGGTGREVEESGTQFECKDCKRQFKDQNCLEAHTESDHPQNPVELVPENPPSVDNDLASSSPPPPPAPMEPSSQSDQSIKGSPDAIPSNSEDEDGSRADALVKCFACESCDRIFMSASGYYTHVLNAHKGRRFNCPHCSIRYAQKASLTVHLRTHHPNSPHIDLPSTILQCPDCPSKFYDRKSLTSHSYSHIKERNYQCHLCSKYYKTSRCLTKHVRCHLSADKFKCTICDKGFNRKIRLDEHYNTHNGSNTLGCQFCVKVFNSYANYSKHMKRKHSAMINYGDRMPAPKRSSNSNTVSALTQNLSPGSTGTVTLPTNSEISIPVTTALPMPIYSSAPAISTSVINGRQPSNSTIITSSQNDESQNNQNNSVVTMSITTGTWTDTNTATNKASNYTHNQQQLNNSGMDLVDCAIHSALISQEELHNQQNLHAHGHGQGKSSNSNNSYHTHSSNLQLTSNAVSGQTNNNQLYKYDNIDPNNTTTTTNFQDMPMELTKVFTESSSSRPLELCVRSDNGDSFSQLVDLTSSKDSNLMGCGNLSHSHHHPQQQYGTPNNNNQHQYHHQQQQQQPIDLISRSDICNLASNVNSVDLSLRSAVSFSDQSTSSFIRELLDLSSRSEYLHEPTTHSSPTKSSQHQLTELNLSCSTNRNQHNQNLYNTPNNSTSTTPSYYNRLPPAPSSIHPPPHIHYTSPTNTNNNNNTQNHTNNHNQSSSNLLHSVYSDSLFS